MQSISIEWINSTKEHISMVIRYTSNLITINDKIKERNRKLWDSIIDDWNHILHDLLPPQRDRNGLRSRGHNFILPRVNTERYKNIFINRSLFNFIYNITRVFRSC